MGQLVRRPGSSKVSFPSTSLMSPRISSSPSLILPRVSSSPSLVPLVPRAPSRSDTISGRLQCFYFPFPRVIRRGGIRIIRRMFFEGMQIRKFRIVFDRLCRGRQIFEGASLSLLPPKGFSLVRPEPAKGIISGRSQCFPL